MLSTIFAPGALCVFYAAALIGVWQLCGPWRRIAATALPLGAVAALLLLSRWLEPLERLLLSTVWLLGLLKCAVALRRERAELRGFSRLGLALYFWVWPGLEMRPFARRVTRSGAAHSANGADRANGAAGAELMRGALCAVAGLALLVALSWNAPRLGFEFTTWGALAALMLAVHLGVGAILPWVVRQCGFEVGALFRAPERADSPSDFWSRRWNVPFIEMDRLLFLRPLRRCLGARGAVLGVFAVSGLLHELGISYPAQGGWGGPLLYFLVQGVTVVSTPKLPRWAARGLAWVAVLLPLPLLFGAPFRAAFVEPLVQNLRDLLHLRPFDWYFSLALWLGGAGHFVILLASFQVPKQLNWASDLARLSRFNRKVFWTYGGFIAGTIVAFGWLALFLHGELLRGQRSAVAIALFIGAFWTARLLTDFFYFGSQDWPRGARFEAGHVALTLLFGALATLFGVVVPLCAWLR